VEELTIDLKVLDPIGEVNPDILFIANRYKGKSIIIYPDTCLEGPVKQVITCKEVREV
jgi:hypothetical protein